MSSFFNDTTFIENKNLISCSYCWESMGNNNNCHFVISRLNILNCFQYFFLTLFIKSRRRFIKYEQTRLLQKCSCKSYSLLLSSWKLRTWGSNISVNSLRESLNNLRGICHLNCFSYLFICCIRLAIIHVVSNRFIEENRFLPNISNKSSIGFQIEVSQIKTSNLNSAFRWIIESLK